MGHASVLLVDDDKNLLRVVAYHIEEAGFDVTPVSSPLDALQHFQDEPTDLVITDLRMPQMDGIELLKRVKELSPETPVIVLTAYGTIDKAVEAVQNGASDFLTKPFEKAEIEHAIVQALQIADLLQENRRLARAVEDKFEFKGIVGSSKVLQNVLDLAAQLSSVKTTVLIQGESGTGKELLARAIHFNSPRKNRPFVVVNCGAIPTDLMESELFGYKKGAFTGASSNKKGKFEVADTGTIFLDEIGELPPNMQVKLLRVLQDGQIDILGDPSAHSVDVRTLAATNRDLHQMMLDGKFREDLYYRLAVAPLQIPPLRERQDDLPLLIHHILSKLKSKVEKDTTLGDDIVEVMQSYNWPGNVRELENVLERLVVFDRKGVVTREDLPSFIRGNTRTVGKVQLQLPEEGFSLEGLERDIILEVLEMHNWNQTRTAEYLGISRNTLIYRMQKFELRKRDHGD